MDTTRQDAWTKDEDVMLAETVLRYIREGKTQLEAFKKVANQLSRTSAACGFRWNASIRKQYKIAIDQAKEDRKYGNRNKQWDYLEPSEGKEEDKLDAAILLLKEMKYSTSNHNEESKKEQEDLVNQLINENEQLKEKLNRYDDAWKEMGVLWNWVKLTDHKTSNTR